MSFGIQCRFRFFEPALLDSAARHPHADLLHESAIQNVQRGENIVGKETMQSEKKGFHLSQLGGRKSGKDI